MARIGTSCYWLISALCTLCILECLSQKVQYEGFKVLRIIPRNKAELNSIKSLQSSNHEFPLNFWKDPTRVNIPVDIMVSPERQEDIIASFVGLFGNDRVKVVMENVQNEIDRELTDHQQPSPARSRMTSSNFDYNRYHTLEDIDEWVTSTAQTYEVATEGSIGLSYEKRPIKYLKISSGEPKPSVLINGGLHGREWITPATMMYLAKYLVEGSKVKGSDAAHLLDVFDFYIIPVLNPDGYVYTWTTDRFWRKTRQPNKKSRCIGTDGNRNFDIVWGDTRDFRSSNDPCHDLYHGEAPFSEPEIASLRDFVIELGKENGNPGVAMYIDYHAYAQFWMTPYGYTLRKPKDYTEQLEGAKIAAEALQQSHGTVYEVGTISSIIYPVSGSSIDYMYDVQNITFSYALEGRPGLEDFFYGFLLPANQIQESGEENWDALVALCNFVADNLADDSKYEDSDGGNGGHGNGGGDADSGKICKYRKILQQISESGRNSSKKGGECNASTAVYISRRKWRKQRPESLI